MKNESLKGIIQIVLGALFCYGFEKYFFVLLGKVGLHFSGDLYLILNAVKYGIMCIVVYILYHAKIRSSKNKFTKSLITSAIFSIGSFVLLVFVNFILHKGIGSFHPLSGYGFSNYFGSSFNLGTCINILINVVFKPFLLIVLFCLGISNIIRKVWSSAILSGLLFGIFYMVTVGVSFEVAFWLALVPSIIVGLSTYFYKTTQNIWMVYIAYVLYVGLGVFVLGYFA
jgi:hypothetical protein